MRFYSLVKNLLVIYKTLCGHQRQLRGTSDSVNVVNVHNKHHMKRLWRNKAWVRVVKNYVPPSPAHQAIVHDIANNLLLYAGYNCSKYILPCSIFI